ALGGEHGQADELAVGLGRGQGAADAGDGVRGLGADEAVTGRALLADVLEGDEIGGAAGALGAGALGEGAVDEDGDVGGALEELLQVAALEEDVAVEEDEGPVELLG